MSQKGEPMKKTLFIIGVMALLAGCTSNNVKINSVNFVPPGGVGITQVTASINTAGEGTILIKWIECKSVNVNTVVKEENISVVNSGTYTTTYYSLDSLDGYYWVNIYDENDQMILNSDSVFFGNGAREAPRGLEVEAYPTSGPAPLNVGLSWNVDNPTMIAPLTTIIYDWGMATPDTLIAYHTYKYPGTYSVSITVENRWGTVTTTRENYITVTP
jgi:PKD repeat protein